LIKTNRIAKVYEHRERRGEIIGNAICKAHAGIAQLSDRTGLDQKVDYDEITMGKSVPRIALSVPRRKITNKYEYR
jgi:hypothetical protein